MKKTSLAIFVIAIIVLGGYWFKATVGVNIFESYSLSNYFPFKYLIKEVIVHPQPGEIIIYESFNSKSIFKRNWWFLWMREEDKVTINYDLNGINDSRCLSIKSSSKMKWSYTYYKFVEVQKGDVFRFEGLAEIQDKDLFLAFTIASFDKDKKVLKWNSDQPGIYRNNQFEMLTKKFTVANGTRFIRFRITGSGVGTFRFDDIQFKKLKPD